MNLKAGTGGKCYNSGQSTAYGERYTTGDKITVIMNFEAGCLEFFKNDEPQGIAYDGLNVHVWGAVSMTASDACVRFELSFCCITWFFFSK